DYPGDSGFDDEWRIEKRNLTDGSLISSFGIGGIIKSNPSSQFDKALGVSIDSTGLYVVGYDEVPGDAQWRIEKRNLADGSIIWVKTSNPSDMFDRALKVAVDQTGVYIIGTDRSNGYSDEQWRIEKRNLVDGEYVASFGTGGVVISNPSDRYDVAVGIAIDNTGIYIVGNDNSLHLTNDQWRIEKRDLNNGSLISSFGTGGTISSNPSNGPDKPLDVTIDNTGIYIAGYRRTAVHSSSGEEGWHIEKRNPTNGSLIWEQTNDPSNFTDIAYGITVDDSGVYVVGSDESPGVNDNQWRIEKRNLYDGSFICSFGLNGIIQNNPSSTQDTALEITIDITGIYIVGVDRLTAPSDERWRIEKRDLIKCSIQQFSSEVIETSVNDVCFVYPDYQGVKPPNVGYAALSDWTSIGFIIGMCSNSQNETLDTDSMIVDTGTGMIILDNSTIILFGGPLVNAPVNYYETNRIAPLYWQNIGGTYYWYVANGTRIDETGMPFSQIAAGNQDMFVVESFLDCSDNKIFTIYGYGWKGTFAGGKFFKFVVYPDIDSYTDSFYVFKWTDDNSDGFVDLDEIDTTPIVSG
ncbi:hypothetical protein ACFLQ6_04160, partial [Thermoproteota archaeon]